MSYAEFPKWNLQIASSRGWGRRNETRKGNSNIFGSNFHSAFKSSPNYLSCWEVARWKGKTKQAINSPSIQMWNEILHQATFYSQTILLPTFKATTERRKVFQNGWIEGAVRSLSHKTWNLVVNCEQTLFFLLGKRWFKSFKSMRLTLSPKNISRQGF